MKKTNKKGFTIVELVIVIAVIAILAAVLIPTFSGVVAKANASAALQEATSAMKSTLAMSQTGTLADGTIFAIGDKNGVTYEFKYDGNKISEKEKTSGSYVALVAENGGTKVSDVRYDRIIINDKMIGELDASTQANTADYAWKDAEKVKSIIKSVFGATGTEDSILVQVKQTEKNASTAIMTDSNAAYELVLKKGAETKVLAVYINSDYPTDLVTFVPATKSTTAN